MDDVEFVPAVVMAECDEYGRPIEGTSKLATPTLGQNEYWKTADGRVVRLEDMTYEHRANLIQWMERHADSLMFRYDLQLASSYLAPRGDHASDAFDEWMEHELERPALDRLRDTAMYRRLVALQ